MKGFDRDTRSSNNSSPGTEQASSIQRTSMSHIKGPCSTIQDRHKTATSDRNKAAEQGYYLDSTSVQQKQSRTRTEKHPDRNFGATSCFQAWCASKQASLSRVVAREERSFTDAWRLAVGRERFITRPPCLVSILFVICLCAQIGTQTS